MLGQYELNRIYCEDCYEVIKKLPDKSVDLIVTDPPYKQSVDHGAGAFGVKKKLHYEQFVEISDGFKDEILDEFIRVLKRINLYIWCSKSQIPMLLQYFVTERKCYWNLITWHKTNVCPTCNNKYMNDTEYCLFFREKGVPIYGNYESKKTFYVTTMNTRDKAKFEHSTIKPLNIMENFVINSTKEGDVVADFFCGSGTLPVACQNLKRKFFACDIKQKWVNIGNNRLNNIQANGQMSLFTEWTMTAYDIYYDFDIEKHKQTYINYLEVLILENGEIVYAIPSHQMKAEEICCKKLGVSQEILRDMCPKEYHFDYLTWLLNISGAVSVWSDFYKVGKQGLNKKQRAKLEQLKLNGLYQGGRLDNGNYQVRRIRNNLCNRYWTTA